MYADDNNIKPTTSDLNVLEKEINKKKLET